MVLLAVGFIGLVLLGTGVIGPVRPGDTPEARGQWTFETGADPATGRPIGRTARAFTSTMATSGCAARHGPVGQRLTTPRFTNLNATNANLTDPPGHRRAGWVARAALYRG